MNNFAAHYTLLGNEELVSIAYYGVGKYKMEARDAAKAELKRRGLSAEELKSLKEEAKELNRIERNQKLRDKGEKYGIGGFIVDILFYW